MKSQEDYFPVKQLRVCEGVYDQIFLVGPKSHSGQQPMLSFKF